MQIDIKMLDSCTGLTNYEKDLIERIDIRHETQSSVADSYGKTPSTVCTQRKKALKKLARFCEEQEKKDKTVPEEEFEKKVFRLFNRGIHPNEVIARLGWADKVIGLWGKHRKLMDDDYGEAMNRLKEYNSNLGGNPGFRLTEQAEYLIQKHVLMATERRQLWRLAEEKGLTNALNEGDDNSILEVMKRIIERELALKFQLRDAEREIQRLREEREQFRNRELILRKSDEAISEKTRELAMLNQQVTERNHLILSLHVRARETVVSYLSAMSDTELLRLFIAAIMKNRLLMAQDLTSPAT